MCRESFARQSNLRGGHSACRQPAMRSPDSLNKRSGPSHRHSKVIPGLRASNLGDLAPFRRELRTAPRLLRVSAMRVFPNNDDTARVRRNR